MFELRYGYHRDNIEKKELYDNLDVAKAEALYRSDKHFAYDFVVLTNVDDNIVLYERH